MKDPRPLPSATALLLALMPDKHQHHPAARRQREAVLAAVKALDAGGTEQDMIEAVRSVYAHH